MITLTLPWPPSANRYWRHARGRTYLSKSAKAFRANVLAMVWSEFGKPKPLTGELGVSLHLTPPTSRFDADNAQKPVLDALEFAGVYADDNQVCELHTFRGPPEPPGAVLVEVWQLHAHPEASQADRHPLVQLLRFGELLRDGDKVLASRAHRDYVQAARRSMIPVARSAAEAAARIEAELIAGRYSPLADQP